MVRQADLRREHCILGKAVGVGGDSVVYRALAESGLYEQYEARAFCLAAGTSGHEGDLAIVLDRLDAVLRFAALAGLLVSTAVEQRERSPTVSDDLIGMLVAVTTK